MSSSNTPVAVATPVAPSSRAPDTSSGTSPYYLAPNNDNGILAGASPSVDDDNGCCVTPDACGNVEREERLMDRQRTKSQRALFGEGSKVSSFEMFVSRERALIIACVAIAVLMNWSTGRYVLYPFKIFSTWVHEMSHGIASILMGGRVYKLRIFKDGGGLATTGGYNMTKFRRGFVASAGYNGTSILGCILLLFRRTTLGPTLGTIGLGICMGVSCLLYVRNVFGMWFLGVQSVVLIAAGWLLPAVILDHLFNFLAATCCLNAVETIHDLYAYGEYNLNNGEEFAYSDASTVASVWGMDYRFWATVWLVQSIVLTVIGVVFACKARSLPSWMHGNGSSRQSVAPSFRPPPSKPPPFVAQTV